MDKERIVLVPEEDNVSRAARTVLSVARVLAFVLLLELLLEPRLPFLRLLYIPTFLLITGLTAVGLRLFQEFMPKPLFRPAVLTLTAQICFGLILL